MQTKKQTQTQREKYAIKHLQVKKPDQKPKTPEAFYACSAFQQKLSVFDHKHKYMK